MAKKYHIYESVSGESQDFYADDAEDALIKWLKQNRILYRGKDKMGDSFSYDFEVTRIPRITQRNQR